MTFDSACDCCGGRGEVQIWVTCEDCNGTGEGPEPEPDPEDVDP